MDHYLHNKQQTQATNINALSGNQTSDPSRPTLCLTTHAYRVVLLQEPDVKV